MKIEEDRKMRPVCRSRLPAAETRAVKKRSRIPMKLGVLTVPLQAMPTEEAFAYLHSLGVETVELELLTE